MLEGASLEAEASSSTKLSVTSSKHFGLLLLRVVAGLGVESSRTESCGTDVEDVLVHDVESQVDKPRTTTGT